MPSWKKEIGPDGLPAWAGINTIYNLTKYYKSRAYKAVVGGAIVLFLLYTPISILLYPTFPVFRKSAFDLTPNVYLSFIILYILITSIFLKIHYIFKRQPTWLGGEWRLIVNETGDLVYEGHLPWSVNLRHVARVEVSPTIQWERVREFRQFKVVMWGREKLYKIPDVEMQTFLVLNDTSRRVVMTANADREGCSTLAHSLREYLEAARGGQAPASPVAPSGGPDRPSFFDL